ncbi:MAG: TonB-dependent receptor domain-containing protein [Candidatus Aminicenantia bacterium]
MIKKLLLWLFLVLFLSFWAYSAQKKGSIHGQVVDKYTQQPLPRATIEIIDHEWKAETDNQGRFKLENIPVGTYQLLAFLKGFEPVVITDIVVDTGHITQQRIEMEQALIKEEITVTADYFPERLDTSTSVQGLNYEEIRRAPGAAEDISRVIQSMPGVAVSGDMRNDIIVRGGSPTENLNIVDNIEFPNINHFATQGASGGSIGMLDTDFVREVNFLSGGFSANYGDKLSSVLDIRLREGSREEFTGDINLSMAGFGGSFEGPIGAKRGSWMISAHRSYLDLLQEALDISGLPEYISFQTKFVYDLNTNHQLSLIGISGIDQIKFEDPDEFTNYQKTYFDQNQYTIGTNLKSLWGAKGYSIFSLSQSLNKTKINVKDPSEQDKKVYNNQSLEIERIAKFDLNYVLSSNDKIRVGISYKWIDNDYQIYDEPGIDQMGISRPGQEIDLDFRSSKASAFLQYDHRFGSKLKLNLGLNYNYFDYIKKSSISPRFGLSYQLTDKDRIGLSYGIYYQSPAYIWLVAHPENSDLEFLQATHYVLSWNHLFRDDTKFTVEIYDKEYKNYPLDVDDPTNTLANFGGEFGSFFGNKLVSQGKGYARGIELFFQKKLIKKIYTLINYSYSDVKFKALDGIWRPGNYDYRHIFTCILGYKPSSKWEFSLKWRYTGGRPYTPFDEELSKQAGEGRLDINQINAKRFPAYHRLDLRVDRRFHFNKWNLVIYFDIENVYNRDNVYFYAWDKENSKIFPHYQWGFLPVGGFSIEF